MSTVYILDGKGITELEYSLPPKEALKNAVNQYVYKNGSTWDLKPVEIQEMKYGYSSVHDNGETILWVRKK